MTFHQEKTKTQEAKNKNKRSTIGLFRYPPLLSLLLSLSTIDYALCESGILSSRLIAKATEKRVESNNCNVLITRGNKNGKTTFRHGAGMELLYTCK